MPQITEPPYSWIPPIARKRFWKESCACCQKKPVISTGKWLKNRRIQSEKEGGECLIKQKLAFILEYRKKPQKRLKGAVNKMPKKPRKKKGTKNTEYDTAKPIICKSCVNMNTTTCEKCPIFKQTFGSRIILK